MSRIPKKLLFSGAFILLTGLAIAHWYFSDRGRFTTPPEYTGLGRNVDGNALHSTYDPALTLHFDEAFRYLGGQKFILYGVADTEQYFFVETHEDNKLKSIYWVQFEAYLPDKSYTYDYEDSPLRVTLGDYEFYTDIAVFHNDPDRKRKRGTDGALVRQFLTSKGYAYPDEVIYARLVYLTDATRQKELMIIFMDDLASYGVTAAQLDEGDSSALQWQAIEKAHLERIRSTLRIESPHTPAAAP